MGQPEQKRHRNNAQGIHRHPGKDAGDDGQRVFPQLFDLPVQRQRKAGGGRGQQVGQVSGALVVGVVVDIQKEQQGDHHDKAKEHGVGQRMMQTLPQAAGKQVHQQRERHPEVG